MEVTGISGLKLQLFVIMKLEKWKDDWNIKDKRSGDQILLTKNNRTDNKLFIE